MTQPAVYYGPIIKLNVDFSPLTEVLPVLSVCVTFLGKFYELLKENNVKFDSVDIEKALAKSCRDAKGKDNRFVSISTPSVGCLNSLRRRLWQEMVYFHPHSFNS